MNELCVSTVRTSRMGRDFLSNNGCSCASSKVVLNAHGLIKKGRSCPFSRNKNKGERVSPEDAQKEKSKHVEQAEIAYFWNVENSKFVLSKFPNIGFIYFDQFGSRSWCLSVIDFSDTNQVFWCSRSPTSMPISSATVLRKTCCRSLESLGPTDSWKLKTRTNSRQMTMRQLIH